MLIRTKHLIIAIKEFNVHKPFILYYSFFDKNCTWISDFLVRKNLNNFVDYLGYYKNYFGSTDIVPA